jgi:hypothetical protein
MGGIELFRVPWAYLHRNLSGKYRVCQLLEECSPFEYLKRTRDVTLANGVFLHLNGHIHVPLVFSDPDLRDVLIPNGNFKAQTFEVLSYVTNEEARRDAAAGHTLLVAFHPAKRKAVQRLNRWATPSPTFPQCPLATFQGAAWRPA